MHNFIAAHLRWALGLAVIVGAGIGHWARGRESRLKQELLDITTVGNAMRQDFERMMKESPHASDSQQPPDQTVQHPPKKS